MKFLVNFRMLWIPQKVMQKDTHFSYFFGDFFSMDLLREETAAAD